MWHIEETSSALLVGPAAAYLASAGLGDAGRVVITDATVDEGGHFAAMEEPRLLVEDIRSFRAVVPAR